MLVIPLNEENDQKISVLRYFLVILLFCVLSISSLYLYLHYRKAQVMRGNIEKFISARENSSLIDSCIINLYSADNYSRLYTVTGNKLYLQKFMADINKISVVIGLLNINKGETSNPNSSRFKSLVNQKTKTTNNYIKLRFLTDSLIKSSNRLSHYIALNKVNTVNIQPTVKVEHHVTIDTVSTAIAKPKKKFFGRLIAAFSNKNSVDKQQVIIKKDSVTTTTNLKTNAPVAPINNFPDYYRKLNAVNNKLMANEMRMVTINNNLIEEIIASLKLYKAVEQLYIHDSKKDLQNNLASVYAEFRQVSVLNFIFLFSFLALVFITYGKFSGNEKKLLDHSEKTEQYALSKSAFLAGMSHEIRTPLNSVIGFSEQLASEHLLPEQLMQVEAIKNSSEMLLELVNEILDFSKYETGKMTFESSPFMVSHAIEDVFTSLSIHALKKNISLVNKVDISRELVCEGDKKRIKQVIINLLGNAVKFTAKGTVTLNAYTVKENKNEVLLKVRITDTGLGIEKTQLPFIFDEFAQVEHAQRATKQKGTGLGLAICKKIIEQQGGKISVISVAGRGSTFSFELPLKKCLKIEDAIIIGPDDEEMAEAVNGKHVLFAEDNKLNILLATTILTKWKVTYDVAHNGLQALELFKQNDYDLVLTDIEMPEMGGLELTGHIRNFSHTIKSNIPIIAMTANVLKEDRDIYFASGINDVVLKPFREKGLISAMTLIMQNNESVIKFMV